MSIGYDSQVSVLRLWLDDFRPAPDGWRACRWPEEVIHYLETEHVAAISLDHDLGDERRTGYDVVTWLERAVAGGFQPPADLRVHSANPTGRDRMIAGLQQVQRMMRAKGVFVWIARWGDAW